MNDYLISIQPKWLALILNGKKTIEVRTRIPAPLKRGEPCTFWGYCTKSRTRLLDVLKNGDLGLDDRPMELEKPAFLKIEDEKTVLHDKKWNVLNGLVVCKFVVETVNKLKWGRWVDQNEWNYRGWNYEHDELLSHTCLSNDQLNNYGDGKPIYALHITALEIIEPLPLSAFKHEVDVWVPEFQAFTDELRPVRHAPQGFIRVLPPKMAEGEKR